MQFNDHQLQAKRAFGLMKKERRTETCDVTTCNIYEMERKLNEIKYRQNISFFLQLIYLCNFRPYLELANSMRM